MFRLVSLSINVLVQSYLDYLTYAKVPEMRKQFPQ